MRIFLNRLEGIYILILLIMTKFEVSVFRSKCHLTFSRYHILLFLLSFIICNLICLGFYQGTITLFRTLFRRISEYACSLLSVNTQTFNGNNISASVYGFRHVHIDNYFADIYLIRHPILGHSTCAFLFILMIYLFSIVFIVSI